MRLLTSAVLIAAATLCQLQSASAQTQIGYVGKNGIFLIAQNQNGTFSGYAVLRLPDASASNTVKLVGAELTEDIHSTSVMATQPQNWPRAHQGTVFKTNLPPAKYPEYVFLATDDPASTGDVWRYPAAYKLNGEWWTLGLFAKTPLDLQFDARQILKKSSNDLQGYSAGEKEGSY